jgi:hypothetical protein
VPADSEEKPDLSPTVAVDGGEELPVAMVELTLAMDSGPLFRIQPLSGPLVPRELRQEQFGAHRRGLLKWQEKELDFRFIAAHEGELGQFEIHGLGMSEDLLGWLQTTLHSEDGRPMLVYQRQQTDSRGWSFLRRVLGDRFEEPLFAADLETWFDPGVCVLRPSGWKHLAHIRRVVELLGGLPGAICGWCAFATAKDDEPLRFISAEVEPLVLDTSWRLVPNHRGRVPHEMGDTVGESYQIRRRFTSLDPKQAALLIAQLAQSGRRSSLEESVDAVLASQLPHMPMPVRLRDTDYFCERATFRVSSPFTLHKVNALPVLDVELSLRGLPTRHWGNVITHRSGGAFSKWDDSNSNRVRLKSTDQSWMLMGDDGSDDDGDATDREASAFGMSLVTESVTPYAARGEYAGFYVKHQPKDMLVVEIADLAVPRTHGGLQEFNDNLETPELTLNSRSVVVTGVAKTAKLNVTGVRFDGDAGSVEIFAEEKVRIKERITVVAGQSSFDQNIKVSGEAEVKKDVKFCKNLEVEGDTKVKGKTDVGT